MSESVIDRLNAALSERYRIEREIGEGGMATVYLAEDLRHGRQVAVKVLRPELAATMGPERFLQEVRVTAQLQHPHILPLYDSGEADGFLFYVMPYIDGESLREKLSRETELPVPDAVRILKEVTDALAAAHAIGLVHRDIKPDNVLLSGRHAMVADFGVAKAVSEATGRHQLTTVGVALGTPSYMAPEQAAADEHIDHRADLYAVGAMAYEMLCGRPPFTGTSARAVLSAHMTQPVTPPSELRPSIPPALEDILLRCLEKKAADRWQSADELLASLDLLLTPSGITPTTTRPLAAVGQGPRPWLYLAVAASVLVGAGWFVVQALGGGGGAGSTEATDAAAERTPVLGVMPLQTRGGRDEGPVWAELAAEAITRQIGRTDRTVLPFSTMSAAAAEGASASEVAAATGATHLVSGTLTTLGAEARFDLEVLGGDGALVRSLDPVALHIDSVVAALDVVAERGAAAVVALSDGQRPWWAFLSMPPSLDVMNRTNQMRDVFNCERDWQAAIDVALDILEDHPDYLPALGQLLPAYANLGRSAERDAAIERLRPHVQRMTTLERAWFDWSTSPTIAGRIRAAEVGFALSPGDWGYAVGYMALQGADLDRALEGMEAVDYDAPGCRWIANWGMRSLVHHLRGEEESALEWADRGLGVEPGHGGLLLRKGAALVALGRIDEARATQASIADLPDGAANQLAVLAQEARRHGQVDFYEELRARSLALLEEKPHSAAQTSTVLFYAGAWERLLPHLRVREQQVDPATPALLGYVAAALEGVGRRAEADSVAGVLAGRFPDSDYRVVLPAMRGDVDGLIREVSAVAGEGGAVLRYGRPLLHRGPWDLTIYEGDRLARFLEQLAARMAG